MDYTNNFNINKVKFDTTIIELTPSKRDIENKILFTLDTENTNKNNNECITYATQLMEFGEITKGGNFEFIPHEKREMFLFTHPSKFWEYLHNCSSQQIELYLFNAEYDVNNLLNYAIKQYGLQEIELKYEEVEDYDGLYEDKTARLANYMEYTYKKIARNGKIYKCEINLQGYKKGKKEGIKKIVIHDMAKKLTGTLKSNVESFTSLKMNKDDLDYSIFRDFGHKEYKNEELLYMWNDVYCLCDLVIEYVFSGKYPHSDKLTTSSMALANYKDELCADIKQALFDNTHKLHNISSSYYEYCRNVKLLYKVANSDNKKYTKEVEQYLEACNNNNDKEFIINNYFTSKDVFNYVFPSLDYETFDFIRPSYCGGITRFSDKKDIGKWINKDGIGVDINSSFPYSYTTFKLPYGSGTWHKGTDTINIEADKLYIIRLQVTNFKIKKNKEPNISKVMLSSFSKVKNLDTWIKEYIGIAELTLTSTDYTYFINNYTYDEIEIKEYIEYKAINGLFDKFTGKFYGIKSQKGVSKAIRTWVKLILNGVYGKFGQNKCSELRQDIYNIETNSIDDTILYDNDNMVEVLSEGVYIPLASFVTSYSRLHLLEVLNIINATKGITWKYCDTDSSYVVGDVDIVKKALTDYIDFGDTGELGKWKIEKYFSKMLIIGIKKYIYYGNVVQNEGYSYHCTLSGINKKYFNFIEEYCNIDNTCICEINKTDREFVKKALSEEINYYVSRETNNPFIYRDKECTDMVKGAYRSIRKKTVKNGQILFNTIYTIRGEMK